MIYPKLSDGTIDWCVMCKHEGRAIFDGCCECEYPENSDDPPTKYEPKPMTNADHIRAMTDEGLADFIAYCTSCETCVVRRGGSNECHNTNCPTAWLDWLRQEADE